MRETAFRLGRLQRGGGECGGLEAEDASLLRIDDAALSQVPKCCGLIGSVRSIEPEQKSLRLRHAHRTLLALLTPPPGAAARQATMRDVALCSRVPG